jgi:serine protease Do
MTHPSRCSPLRAATLSAALSLAIAGTTPLAAQEVRVWTPAERELSAALISRDRLVLGISTNEVSERADTLGLRVLSVEKDSPAEKAGLKAGDRLQAINGVSLRADRADAGERDYDGVITRRLQREMAKVKEGASIDLRVVTDGRARTVKVEPVKSSDLYGSRGAFAWTTATDRAMLGLTIGSTASQRDTLGVFVSAVTTDGPAEKAGIIEGDRIAAINGVSVRVAPADAEDYAVGAAKTTRLRSEIAKLKAGDTAELTIVSAGRTRTVRVTAVKASEMPRSASGAAEIRVLQPAMGEMLRRLEVERAAPRPPATATPPAPPAAPTVRTRIIGQTITI